MPITQFQLKGQWGPDAKRKYGYNNQDTGILENPKATQKIHKSWSNSKNDFEFYFLRSFKASKHREEGEKSTQWVKENLELDIQPNPEAITVIFTQNTGAEKIPMTAWAIAHRLGHAIKNDKTFEIHFKNEVQRDFREILKNVYKVNPFSENPNSLDFNEKGLRALAYAVGTMKSARERKLVRFYEFIYELTAQYIITGKIKLNPLPQSLMLQSRMAWGRPNNTYTSVKVSSEELQEWNEMLEGHAQKYEYYLDTIFEGLVGKLFVM
jgi:hypothetical protein